MSKGKHSKSNFIDPQKKFAILTAVIVVGALLINISCTRFLVDAIQKGIGPNSTPSGIAHVFRVEPSTSAIPSVNNTAPSQEMESLKAQVQQIVAPYGDNVSVVVAPVDGSPGFAINENRRFVSASMIKLLILAEFLSEVDGGVKSLNSTYTLEGSDIVGGTGKIQGDSPGTTYTYDDLARYMITHSDNTATNILIDSMGMSMINARAARLGLTQTDLQRKMMDLDSGRENHISAADAAAILLKTANHTLASEAMCTKAESYLQAQTDTEGLAQGVPHNIPFGHKTGSLDSIRHDGGIVYSSKPYVIVVLTSLDAGTANSLMARVSETVYNTLK